MNTRNTSNPRPQGRLLTSIGMALGLLATPGAHAQGDRSEPKGVPRMQAVPQAGQQVSFQRNGVEIARYHFGPELSRPFVFPLIGPAGRSVTRIGHPRDPQGHRHHYSVWISHRYVNGVDFWAEHDPNAGRILHQRVEEFDDGPDVAAIQTENAWVDRTGNVLLKERRRTTTQWMPDSEWLLIIDLQLGALNEAVTLGKASLGVISVRMAKTIGVHDGGGTILNSEGGVNQKGVFWKPARWVDYSGPITPTAMEGATLFDHPANPNHPSVFHVRDDGWMGASLTFDEARVIMPGKPLQLRYGIYVHAGQPSVAELQRRWEEFARTTPHEFQEYKGK